MHITELSIRTYNPHDDDGFEYRSVGWLGGRVPQAGDPDPLLIESLRRLWQANQLPDDWEGLHDCEICPPPLPPPVDESGSIKNVFDRLCAMIAVQPASMTPSDPADPGCRRVEFNGDSMGLNTAAKGEFFVQDGQVRYVLPNLVFHYILKHNYKLPGVVEAAVRRACTPEDEDGTSAGGLCAER